VAGLLVDILGCPVIQQAARRPKMFIEKHGSKTKQPSKQKSCIQTRSMLVRETVRRDDYLIVGDRDRRISGWSAC